MKGQLLEKAREVSRSALQRGAQGARVDLSRVRNSRVDWLNSQLDRVRESTTMSLSITLYVDGRYSSHSTSDLRPEALDRFIEETVAMTRLLARNHHRRLPDPSRYADRFAGNLQLYDPSGSSSITGIQRRRTAQALEDAARSVPGSERIISVESICSDSLYENVMVSSNGMEGVAQATSFTIYTKATIRDEGDRKPSGSGYSVRLHLDRLRDVESVGAEATNRALRMLGQGSMPSGTYACVIENRRVGRAMGGLLQALYGNSIQQQQSFLADKMDQRVVGEALTLIDDPHIIGGLESRTYDNEGMSTHAMPIFERGVLRNFYLDTYYASKLEQKATSGKSSNLVFEYGHRDLEGLLRTMGTGILITDFIGGNSNSTTGDFSIGIRGFWVENGQRVRPLAEMNLSGNHLESWNHLVEVGNDIWLNSSTRAASVRFDELQFTGS